VTAMASGVSGGCPRQGFFKSRAGGIAFGHARVRFAIGMIAREARSCVQTQGLRLGSHPASRLE
jgi:hypothetical protein